MKILYPKHINFLLLQYEDSNGHIYVKNCYRKIDIQKPEEIKYFIDKWMTTQTFAQENIPKIKYRSRDRQKLNKDELNPESIIAPTLFMINLMLDCRMTRIYIVAFPPYIPDLNSIPKEIENFRGLESANFCINKTIDLVLKLKESQILNYDFEEFFQILNFTNLLKNVLNSESSILFFGQMYSNEKPASLVTSNGYLNIVSQINNINEEMQFGEAMKDEKYNENETINDQISDVSDVSEVKTFKLNSKIDAIKRAEKAKLEDIRNLLGLNLTQNIDFECILSK